jgi:hypothetical protein
MVCSTVVIKKVESSSQEKRGLIVFGCKHRSPQTTPISEFRALLGSLLSEVIEFERWTEIKKIIYAHVSFVNLTPIWTPFKTKNGYQFSLKSENLIWGSFGDFCVCIQTQSNLVTTDKPFYVNRFYMIPSHETTCKSIRNEGFPIVQ